jgi:hypothetical protein
VTRYEAALRWCTPVTSAPAKANSTAIALAIDPKRPGAVVAAAVLVLGKEHDATRVTV